MDFKIVFVCMCVCVVCVLCVCVRASLDYECLSVCLLERKESDFHIWCMR